MEAKKNKKFFEYNRAKVPSIGLGTAYMNSDISEVIYSSIKEGTRLIDTALNYGSEEGIGKELKEQQKKEQLKEKIYLLQQKETMKQLIQKKK